MLIFEKELNYFYFLQKYNQFIGPIADTFAYCLLPNHFHFLMQTKDEKELTKVFSGNVPTNKSEQNISKNISLQFSHFFNGYTQAFNKQQERNGKLFELPFRRIAVNEEEYFSRLVFYIHTNPQTHGLIGDFKQWPYSSYKSHLSSKPTKLKREAVLDWFGGRDAYQKFHNDLQNTEVITHLLLEN